MAKIKSLSSIQLQEAFKWEGVFARGILCKKRVCMRRKNGKKGG